MGKKPQVVWEGDKMKIRRRVSYILAYEGVSGTAHVAEFESYSHLKKFQSLCPGQSCRITRRQLESPTFRNDTIEDPYRDSEFLAAIGVEDEDQES